MLEEFDPYWKNLPRAGGEPPEGMPPSLAQPQPGKKVLACYQF
jgi:hypothetical protein